MQENYMYYHSNYYRTVLFSGLLCHLTRKLIYSSRGLRRAFLRVAEENNDKMHIEKWTM